MQIDGAVDQKLPLGRRIQVYLRTRFGRDAAKKAAALTGVDVRTARGWIEEGREPKGAALLAIITDMGRDGLLAIFSPEVECHESRLRRKINEHGQEIARLRAQLGKGVDAPANQNSVSPCSLPEMARANGFGHR